MGNRMKVFQDSMSRPRSRHNMTNPDKLKLVNYNPKICNTEIFQVQNFVRKNFDDSTWTRQIRQTFPPSVLYYTVVLCFVWQSQQDKQQHVIG